MIARKGGDCGELQSTSSQRASQTLHESNTKGLEKGHCTHLTVSNSETLEWDLGCVLLKRYQAMLMLLVQRPHFENSWSIGRREAHQWSHELRAL